MKKNLQEICATLTEHEKEILRKRMNDTPEPFHGVSVGIYFPRKSGLESISYVGIPPKAGDLFYLRQYGKIEDDSCNFENRYVWRVKSINYSAIVNSNEKERLLFPIEPRCEVHVVEPFSRKWWRFKLKYWYDPKYEMKKWFKEKWRRHMA